MRQGSSVLLPQGLMVPTESWDGKVGSMRPMGSDLLLMVVDA